MKIKRISILSACLSLPLSLFVGCLKEGDDTLVLPTPDGKIPYSVIPKALQDSLRNNGFVIHEGLNPPTIDGTFLVSPMQLRYASDHYHNLFHDLVMTFAGQYRRGAVSYSETQTDTVAGRSMMANVIGEGDRFTMYCYQTVAQTNLQEDTLYRCTTATVVSGLMGSDGIEECQYSSIILDKWAANDYYASQIPPESTFRIWDDGDSLAVRLRNAKTMNQ